MPPRRPPSTPSRTLSAWPPPVGEVRIGGFALGVRGALLDWLARRTPALAGGYRQALQRAGSLALAEALMRGLCEDIARVYGLPAPEGDGAALRRWLQLQMPAGMIQEHLRRNASYYGALRRLSPGS